MLIFEPDLGLNAAIGLIGVPFDDGARYGNSRPGAAQGPAAIRKAMERYGEKYDLDNQADLSQIRCVDLGDVEVIGGNSLATHNNVTNKVKAALDRGILPITIGGAHDISFATIRALATKGQIGGINIDAHFDVRPIENSIIRSGTPFRRCLEELDNALSGTDFWSIGMNGTTNSQEHHQYLINKDSHIVTLQELLAEGHVNTINRALESLPENSFLSIDIDVIQQAFAPGCSSPAPRGLTPDQILDMAFLAGKCPKIKLFDLMEVSPPYDIDNRTSRLAVAIIHSFICGYAQRKNQTTTTQTSSNTINTNTRPLYPEFKPTEAVRAQTGTNLRCQCWETEAALRMLENNIDPDVALVPEELIVYGGSGRAARNWKCYNKIVESLKSLAPDETMLVQSGKAVGILKTHRGAPRVLIANSNIVPAWSTQDNFDEYDRLGLMMYGQMTAGSWIYIGTQGILQGTYETFAAIAEQKFGGSLRGKWVVTGGLGGMSGAQPLAVTMNEGIALVIESYPDRVAQKVREGYCDRSTDNLDQALIWIDEALRNQQPIAIGLVGNCADVLPELIKRNRIPDIVTDQTSAHSLLDYIPSGNLHEVLQLKITNPEEYKRRSQASIVRHTEAILQMQERGAIAFDYGNNLRGQAEIGGLNVRNQNGEFRYPGFVPAYIRPLFCEGKGPFRWAALSGDPEDIRKIDRKILETFPHDHALARWIRLAGQKVPFIGLPTRVCWLGYGDRAKMGLIINDMVASGELKAPIVIGRDHLDCGSVASPNRETENMKDGSDAIADWPLLNALANTACGADWVSIHNGGGVGIGNSTHAGMVIVATGTPEKAEQLQRVLTADPGLGVMRHADAGYEIAINVAKNKNVKIPHLEDI